MFRKLCFTLEFHSVRATSNFLSPTWKPLNSQFRLPRSNYTSLHATLSTSSKMGDTPIPRQTIPDLDKASRPEILRGIESYLGTRFREDPAIPKPCPLVLVISGPSGVGKDAVIKKLKEERSNLHTVVTVTSRAMRAGEIDGVDYFFVSKEEFLAMDEKNELLESALVYGDYKGIPKRQIKECLAKGRDVLLRVDVQGAYTLRRMFGNSAVFVFLVAESQMKLVERLIDRRTESVDDLLVRIATAKEEMKCVDNFDYVVVNAEGNLEEAARLLGSIIDAEKAKVVPRQFAI